MRYKKINLLNGATLYYTKNRINPITCVDIGFNCGAREDTIPGIAHFCEHLFFTGTKKYNKEQISKKYFDFIGVNAFTSDRGIYFTGDVLSNEFVDYIDTVAEMITESEFKPKEIEKEKKVVIQEISRSKDNYWGKSYDFNAYNQTKMLNFKNGVLGSEEDIKSIKRKDIVDFISKYFISNNLEVACCSPLSERKIKKIFEEHLIAKLNKNDNFIKLPLYSDYVVDDSFIKNSFQPIDKCYLYVNFLNDNSNKDEDYCDRRRFLLMLMNDYTTGVMKKLRIENSLVYDGHFNQYSNDKNTNVTFRTECDAKNVNEVIKKLAEYIQDIFKNGFTDAQLKDQKRKLDYSKKSMTPTIKREMDRLYDLKYFDKVRGGKRKYEKLKRLTKEDMIKTLKETIISDKVSISVYGNLKKKDLITKDELNELFRLDYDVRP